MNEAKARRIAAAEHARQLKRARATNALSIALLRAESARVIMLDELTASSAGTEAALGEHREAMSLLAVSPIVRASTMVVFFYASLNVVVEGWLQPDQPPPRLTDPRIDALLHCGHPKMLADFRNMMLHPNPLTDPRLERFAAGRRELSAWAQELCGEFLRYFREWGEQYRPASDVTSQE